MSAERLIVFLKAPREGQVKTRLAESIGAPAATAAYRQLVETLLSALEPLSEVQLCFSPPDAQVEIQNWLRRDWTAIPQTDGDLGQRLQGAFETAFETGAQRVVVIGSDCPTVTPDDIQNAWEALKTHEVVLGPASDGGYWLIGLRQPQPALFRQMIWSTDTVLVETLERARRLQLSVHLLREQTDIDTEREWEAFAVQTKQTRNGPSNGEAA